MTKNLQIRQYFDLQKIRDLLLTNGVDGFEETPTHAPILAQFHTTSSLDKKLQQVSRQTKIVIPQNPFFSLFYNLDDLDFGDAYLYCPEFKNYLMIRDPQLIKLQRIGKGLTRLVPIPLVSVYEGRRFSIPRLQIYSRGKIVQESDVAGTESYS